MAIEKEDDRDAAEGDILEGGDGKGKSKKKLFLILIPVLLLIGGGVGLYFSGLLDGILGKKVETEETADATKAGKDVTQDGKEAKGGKDTKKSGDAKHGEGAEGEVDPNAVAFLEIPDIIVNLNSDGGKPQFLRLSVQLEMENQEDLAAVQAIMPRVVDQFQTYLRELRVQDIRGSKGMYRLQQELLTRVNNAAAPIEVKDVLFQEILIQ